MRALGKYTLEINCWLPMRLAADAEIAFEKNIQAVSPTNAKSG